MRVQISVPVRVLTAAGFAVLLAASGHVGATQCGSLFYPFPFVDVLTVPDVFCPGIMEAYVTGVTKGTSATTFSPTNNVDRQQMTTFLQRSLDQGLKRNNRRAALGQWWTPTSSSGLQKVALPGAGPATFCKSDGERIYVANGNTLIGVDRSTGQLQLQFVLFGIVTQIAAVVVANGWVYAVGGISPGFVTLEPTPEPPSYWTAAHLHVTAYHPNTIAFDGDRVWTANYDDGTVSIISVTNGLLNFPGATVAGFNKPIDVLFDGANIWVTDAGTGNLYKLNSAGAIVQTVPVGTNPSYMAFDGANIWVPNHDANSITVVQASTGAVTATISGDATNRLNQPLQAAFDGERILVTNPGNDSVTLFRAADLSLIGNVQLAAGSLPYGACSDGINFWITLYGTNKLLRF